MGGGRLGNVGGLRSSARGCGMLGVTETIDRVRFWRNVDRLGPDIPWTHWRLHFRSTMVGLCSRKFAHFGNGADFRPGAYAVVCSKISIGARVVVRPGSMLFADPRPGGSGIAIEDDVMLGSGVHIYTLNHRFSDRSMPIIEQGHSPSRQVTLRRGCWIGANAILLPGVEIGANAVVAAGSVVTRSVAPHVLVAGNPGRVVRSALNSSDARSGSIQGLGTDAPT
jgi:acetyltransferase-like isoleucine patch superfamily enzyme